jgi:hypothetical protein
MARGGQRIRGTPCGATRPASPSWSLFPDAATWQPPSHPDAPALRTELEDFRATVTHSGRWTFGARAGQTTFPCFGAGLLALQQAPTNADSSECLGQECATPPPPFLSRRPLERKTSAKGARQSFAGDLPRALPPNAGTAVAARTPERGRRNATIARSVCYSKANVGSSNRPRYVAKKRFYRAAGDHASSY